MTTTPIILPPLIQQPSPNQSSRHGVRPSLIVWHETAGAYAGAVSWLCNPEAQASAHIVVREDGNEATQLVPISEKSWNCVSFNPQSIGIEHANVTAKGYSTDHQLAVSARIFGFICLRYGIPPRWSRHGQSPGMCRHLDLGLAGGGHSQCGTSDSVWLKFMDMVHAELTRGGYRKEWCL